MTEPVYFDAEMVALYAGVEQATVRSWVHRGHITKHRRGFARSEVDDWLAKRNQSKVHH